MLAFLREHFPKPASPLRKPLATPRR